ncbi:GyrI-like domain-containing protein [candidate division WOR-3 bacterium]|nr:GyrI-like domain-containing protein [candidate division WOR-3 bacterium]
MSRNAVVLVLAVTALAVIGCGGQKPAEPQVQKPAEPAFAAELVTTDSMVVASVSKMGPYSNVGQSVAELMTWLGSAKVQLAPDAMPFGVYFDNPAQVKPESTRYEVCIPVPKGTKGDKKAGVVVRVLPPMQLAQTAYTGPYEKAAPVYAGLYKWIGEKGYTPAGPMIEFYLSDPAKVPAESLQSKVCVVLAPVPAPPPDTTAKAGGETKPEAKPDKVGR